MKNITLVLLGCLLITTAKLWAQTKSIEIWNGNVPNAIVNPDYKLIDDSSGTWTFMRQITAPKLDFYPAPKELSTGVSVIICPGGGYWALAYKHEGTEVAKWLNSLGVSAFILKYRLPDNSIMQNKSIAPLQDAQEAMRIVRRNASDWNIDADKIGIMGFSAGGHLASTLSTHYADNVYKVQDSTSARPDFSILIYPVITMDSVTTHMGSRILLLGDNPTQDQINHFSNETKVDKQTPPAFIVHSFDDDVVPPKNSINYALAMNKNHVACELHLYTTGGHGYGMGQSNGTESTWTKACEKWLQCQFNKQ